MSKFEGTIRAIGKNYKQLEESIVSQLKLNLPDDDSIAIEVWRSLFEQIIPKKFVIEQGIFIIDSQESISKKVDIAIYDNTYTPYIFNYGKIKFIPIEAVACVIQCRGSNVEVDDKDNIDEWLNSIDVLQTSLNSIARMQNLIVANENYIDENFKKILKKENEGKNNKNEEEAIQYLREKYEEEIKEFLSTQTSTRPIKFLCHTAEKYENDGRFDFVISIASETDLSIDYENNNLQEWHKKLNHSNKYLYEILVNKSDRKKNDNTTDTKKNSLEEKFLSNFKVENYNIMSLIFQLNQLLMLINNPMLFPHQAYVNMFNKILNEGGEDGVSKKTRT